MHSSLGRLAAWTPGCSYLRHFAFKQEGPKAYFAGAYLCERGALVLAEEERNNKVAALGSIANLAKLSRQISGSRTSLGSMFRTGSRSLFYKAFRMSLDIEV